MPLPVSVIAVAGYVLALVVLTHDIAPEWLGNLSFPVSILLAALAGAAIGRWWVVLLALLPTLVAMPFSEDGEDGLIVVYAAYFGTPIYLAAILFGLVPRKLGERRRHNRSEATST